MSKGEIFNQKPLKKTAQNVRFRRENCAEQAIWLSEFLDKNVIAGRYITFMARGTVYIYKCRVPKKEIYDRVLNFKSLSKYGLIKRGS